MPSPMIVCMSTDSIAAEYSTRLAVDVGYRVIKLEAAGGDPLRARRGRFADFLLAGKESVLLGKGGLQGKALQDLLDGCSGIVTDEAGRDSLQQQTSRTPLAPLVVVGERDAGTLRGMSGSHSDEFLAFHGSGLGFITPRVMPGYPSAGPLCPQANLLEFLAGLYGAIALFALICQGASSDIRSASAGLCAAALPLMRREISSALLEGTHPHRAERIWQVSPAEVHRCNDGWLFVDVIEDIQWTRLCNWMGRPELGTDPRYTTREQRFADAETLCAILDKFFADKPQACWMEAQAVGVPVAPVNSLHDLLGDPQLAARGFWGSLINTSGQTQRMPLSPLARLFRSHVTTMRVPAPGAQTHTVLASLETA